VQKAQLPNELFTDPNNPRDAGAARAWPPTNGSSGLDRWAAMGAGRRTRPTTRRFRWRSAAAWARN